MLSFTSFGASCRWSDESNGKQNGEVKIDGSGELTKDDVDGALKKAKIDQDTIKSVVIGKGITELKIVRYNGTFQNWGKLENVTFEKGSQLGSIGNHAFYNCNKLQNITIPDNVTNIGKYAFAGCGALQSVYYTGTEKEWDKISIEKDGNDQLKKATVEGTNGVKLYCECKNPNHPQSGKADKDGKHYYFPKK